MRAVARQFTAFTGSPGRYPRCLAAPWGRAGRRRRPRHERPPPSSWPEAGARRALGSTMTSSVLQGRVTAWRCRRGRRLEHRRTEPMNPPLHAAHAIVAPETFVPADQGRVWTNSCRPRSVTCRRPNPMGSRPAGHASRTRIHTSGDSLLVADAHGDLELAAPGDRRGGERRPVERDAGEQRAAASRATTGRRAAAAQPASRQASADECRSAEPARARARQRPEDRSQAHERADRVRSRAWRVPGAVAASAVRRAAARFRRRLGPAR